MDIPKQAQCVVIGGGVIGCSVAFHLMALGARSVLLLEQSHVGSGTSQHSSGILRTHYSVPQNVELALRSWRFFENFAQELDDPQASAGLVRCGYLIVAPPGEKSAALRAALQAQRERGIPADEITAAQAQALLPIARFAGDELIGHEPHAGFADATLTATAFARAAKRRGARVAEGVQVLGLQRSGSRITGVLTSQGPVSAEVVVSAQNIWAGQLAQWLDLPIALVPERHRVLNLAGPSPYSQSMPVFKDLASPGMLYARSYGGQHMLVSEGTPGESLDEPDLNPGDVSLDWVAQVGEQVAARFPGWESAGLANAWTGVYDVTPDWNPVLGHPPGVQGLVAAYGFSGHGFKLSPAVGRVLAQCALGLTADVDLAPYAWERFGMGRLLLGRYGAGAVS